MPKKITKIVKKAGRISAATFLKIFKEVKPDEIVVNKKGEIILKYTKEF